MPLFSQWDSFYLIVGGAAGALIGLQFVVLTLIANSAERPQPEAGDRNGPDHSYVALMLANVRTMASALGGDPSPAANVDPTNIAP